MIKNALIHTEALDLTDLVKRLFTICKIYFKHEKTNFNMAVKGKRQTNGFAVF